MWQKRSLRDRVALASGEEIISAHGIIGQKNGPVRSKLHRMGVPSRGTFQRTVKSIMLLGHRGTRKQGSAKAKENGGFAVKPKLLKLVGALHVGVDCLLPIVSCLPRPGGQTLLR